MFALCGELTRRVWDAEIKNIPFFSDVDATDLFRQIRHFAKNIPKDPVAFQTHRADRRSPLVYH